MVICPECHDSRFYRMDEKDQVGMQKSPGVYLRLKKTSTRKQFEGFTTSHRLKSGPFRSNEVDRKAQHVIKSERKEYEYNINELLLT